MMIIIGTDLTNKIMWIYLVLIASEKRWYFYKTFGLHHCLTKLFSWISWWASSRRFASFWEARCFSWRKARNGESEMKFSGQCQATGLDAIHVPCLTLWDMSDILSHISYINIKSWHGSYNIATHPSLLKRSWQIPPAWMLVTTKWRNSSGLGASWEWRRGKVDHWPMLINLLGCVVGLCSATMGCW